MVAVDTKADGLSLFLTGGASNGNPDLSLGGLPSSVRLRGLGAIALGTPIPALQILNVSPDCGEGVATLQVDGSGNLTFTPPGDSPGVAVTPISGGSVIVAGDDLTKFVRVYQEVGLPYYPGAMSLQLVDIVNGVLGQRNILNAQRLAGRTTYRAIMLSAPGATALHQIGLWTPPVVGAQATYQLALETPSAGAIQTIANETTAPTAVSFGTYTSQVGALPLYSLAAGGTMGLWIKRVFPVGTMNPLEKAQLAFTWIGE